jgi:hypothetical protein
MEGDGMLTEEGGGLRLNWRAADMAHEVAAAATGAAGAGAAAEPQRRERIRCSHQSGACV